MEAALVLPVALAVILLTIYLFFYQYDRCLMEFDTITLFVKSREQWGEEKEVAAERLNRGIADLSGGAYVAWEQGEVRYLLKGNTLRIENAGSVRFPFSGFGLSVGGSIWETQTVYEEEKWNPVTTLRLVRRVKESVTDEPAGDG